MIEFSLDVFQLLVFRFVLSLKALMQKNTTIALARL